MFTTSPSCFSISHCQRYLSCLHSPYFAITIHGAGLEHSCVALWDYLLPPDNRENHSDSFYPQYLQVRDDSPEHLSSHLQILFLHLYHSKEGYVQLPCQLAPISSYLSPYVRQSSCSASEHGGREIWGKFIWVSSPSSHCSINTDILRITVPMIKARQSGNYLLLSTLPVVIRLKPIPSNFRLCEILFCRGPIKMLSKSPGRMTDKWEWHTWRLHLQESSYSAATVEISHCLCGCVAATFKLWAKKTGRLVPAVFHGQFYTAFSLENIFFWLSALQRDKVSPVLCCFMYGCTSLILP